ncbi:uncharacterized protein LOC118762688 [Octopus sinensis]|uniref:Uncharacterized protein LOC118762688 n=1 Tax=Octopus sinensis TaxID=2607531 RepID=A0A7E6ES24_9MOLL|nr:uncharacterized protein LOC118762688 [Octopus sinensis]
MNVEVDDLNIKLLQTLPGERHIYSSIDTVLNIDEAVNYPTSQLAPQDWGTSYAASNLDLPKLCNGTRFIIKKMMPGKASGEPVFIPKILLIPSDMPFQYKRLQFSLKLSFAMSINKAQGQSLAVVCLNLVEAVFSHGQLYVGCSSIGNPNHLFIYAPQGKLCKLNKVHQIIRTVRTIIYTIYKYGLDISITYQKPFD